MYPDSVWRSMSPHGQYIRRHSLQSSTLKIDTDLGYPSPPPTSTAPDSYNDDDGSTKWPALLGSDHHQHEDSTLDFIYMALFEANHLQHEDSTASSTSSTSRRVDGDPTPTTSRRLLPLAVRSTTTTTTRPQHSMCDIDKGAASVQQQF